MSHQWVVDWTLSYSIIVRRVESRIRLSVFIQKLIKTSNVIHSTQDYCPAFDVNSTSTGQLVNVILIPDSIRDAYILRIIMNSQYDTQQAAPLGNIYDKQMISHVMIQKVYLFRDMYSWLVYLLLSLSSLSPTWMRLILTKYYHIDVWKQNIPFPH